jgi:hypothetical protein
MRLLDKYINYIQEGYMISNKTISIDLDKFESGESNVLLIAGLPAAGKTTLGYKLEKKYNAKLVRSDWCLSEKLSIDKKKYKDPEVCYRDSFNIALKSNKRYIIEGVLVYWSCIKEDNTLHSFFNQCKNTPTIILGTSVIKTFWRGWLREKDKESLREIIRWYLKNGIVGNKVLNIFRKERLKVKSSDIKEFKI